jgi:hypothetical protein
MCKTGYLRSLNYQIRLFLSIGCFGGWFRTLLEGDIRMTWRWVNMPGTCGGGTHVTWLSSPPFSFFLPPPDTSFSLSPHPYPERRSSRAVDSNGGKLVRWRKTRETTVGSCDGACRAIRHEGLVCQSQNGSCGRARGERTKEET